MIGVTAYTGAGIDFLTQGETLMSKPIFLAIALALGASSASAQLSADRGPSNPESTVRLLSTSGEMVEVQFSQSSSASIENAIARSGGVPDGQYKWQIIQKLAVESRLMTDVDRDEATGRLPSRWPVAVPVRSGTVFIKEGRVIEGSEVQSSGRPKSAQPKAQVINDDLIVNGGSGSACIGLDCISAEAFGFDTVRLKENNTRLAFIDTSTSASFPSRDWELTANDSSNGGANAFSITDRDQGTQPFVVEGGGESNTVYVAANQRLGIGTSIPVRSIHSMSGDTPALRLEQVPTLGFPAQTWDLTGNETGLTVRDSSNATQPLRIRPGAPTNAAVIAANGSVGIGTATPAAALEVMAAAATPLMVLGSAATPNAVVADASGNLAITGTLSQGSSRLLKEGIVAVANDSVLAALGQLPIYTWQYIGAAERHIGPVAEEFHALFGFGQDPTRMAPGDLAGVAVAATQALQQKVAEKDREIADLRARLERLEALIGQPAVN